ncbi:MAG: Nramp family divalent metal transporter [Patescibacteria group bacterium]|jgi:NRAMP (natural resistance-associated macrophage protein)-like metal ion transporter
MPKFFKKFFKKFGPGFITGASDDDPSGIATYTQVGAQFGFGQLWLALFSFPLMAGIQETVARIGMVTGRGLTATVRRTLPKWVLYIFTFLILIANTANIGADLGAMADASRLLVPQVPFAIFAIGFTVLILVLEIFLTYKTYAKILKWFALTLFSYLITVIIVTTNWKALLLGAVVPHIAFDKNFFLMITAVLGTTISPYLFIWQSNEEVEEEVAEGKLTVRQRKGASNAEIRGMRQDTIVGMGFSQAIMFCIIATAAGTFFRHGLIDIQSSAQAAQALAPLAGRFASLIFSIGIIGTGLLAVPVLSASASYALSEAFGWKDGLYKKFKQAHGFYGVITIATLIGLLINFVGINPIKALIYAAVLNGLATPPLILIIMKIANDKKIMGRWINGKLSNTLGIVTLIVTITSAILVFVL